MRRRGFLGMLLATPLAVRLDVGRRVSRAVRMVPVPTVPPQIVATLSDECFMTSPWFVYRAYLRDRADAASQ